MKVVIDTNVLIDGSYDDNSYANKIIEEILKKRIRAFANKKTLRENSLILRKLIKNREYLRKVEEMLSLVKRVEPQKIRAVKEDSQDDKILASALAAGAEYLVTSDGDLLKLKEYGGVQIVDPAAFWNRYRQEVLRENDWQKFVDDFLKS